MIKGIKNTLHSIEECIYEYCQWVMGIVVITYFARSVTEGFIKGGRWDLYQNIAMADSVSLSNADVASSNTSISGLLYKALAIANL